MTDDSNKIIISDECIERLVDIINNPPEPCKELIEAFKRYNEAIKKGELKVDES